jgi:hypothetical protein
MRVSPEEVDAFLRKSTPSPRRLSSRERAAASRLSVLAALSMYGHLRSIEISRACWPRARWGLQMAQRCLRALVKSGEATQRRNAVGSTSFVLSIKGSHALASHGLKGRHGLDIKSYASGNMYHHSIVSRYVIEKKTQGYEGFTEFGIAAGHAPISTAALRERVRKICDGILIKDNQLFLIECEVAKKDVEQIARILYLVYLTGARVHADLPYVFGGLIILHSNSIHAQRVKRVASSIWCHRPHIEMTALARRVTLAAATINLPLVWRELKETTLEL